MLIVATPRTLSTYELAPVAYDYAGGYDIRDTRVVRDLTCDLLAA